MKSEMQNEPMTLSFLAPGFPLDVPPLVDHHQAVQPVVDQP